MQLQRQLNNAVAVKRGRHLAAGSRVDQRPRKREDRVIRDIEELGTELQAANLSENEILQERHVRLEQVVAAENATT